MSAQEIKNHFFMQNIEMCIPDWHFDEEIIPEKFSPVLF